MEKSKKRKKIKNIALSLLAIALSFVLFLIYSLYANQAPITQGKVSFNVPYKPGKHLDIYTPTKRIHERSPVILYIHGGAWIMGKKEGINFNRVNGAIHRLRAEGYTVISPEYTLAKKNQTPFPACVQDGFDALHWVAQNADSLSLDLSNLGIMGESAGGHIALLLAFASPSQFGLSHEKVAIDYVIDIYGPADLYNLYHRPEVDSLNAFLATLPPSINKRLDLPRFLFGFDPKEDSVKAENFMEKYSPLEYLHTKAPPVLMIHGKQDHIVPLEQSLTLKASLDSLSINNEIKILEGVCHAFIGAKKTQKAAIQDWIFDFIVSKTHFTQSTDH